MDFVIQLALNSEARRARQVVKVLNSEGKIVAYAKPQLPMVSLFFLIFLMLFSFKKN